MVEYLTGHMAASSFRDLVLETDHDSRSRLLCPLLHLLPLESSPGLSQAPLGHRRHHPQLDHSGVSIYPTQPRSLLFSLDILLSLPIIRTKKTYYGQVDHTITKG
jgi:hypothetical protein